MSIGTLEVIGKKVSEGTFLASARKYNAQRKLIDALVASDNPDDAIASALATIADLQNMRDYGSEYTPSTALGFGSENAATIASGILGEGMTGAQLRKKFSDVGKPKKQ